MDANTRRAAGCAAALLIVAAAGRGAGAQWALPDVPRYAVPGPVPEPLRFSGVATPHGYRMRADWDAAIRGDTPAEYRRAAARLKMALQEAREDEDERAVTLGEWMLSEVRRATHVFARARMDAARDVEKGRLVQYVAGLPLSYESEIHAVLRRDYGVEIVPVAGCNYGPVEAALMAGYNGVSVPAIERRYGKGFVGRIGAEVAEREERKRKLTIPAEAVGP